MAVALSFRAEIIADDGSTEDKRWTSEAEGLAAGKVSSGLATITALQTHSLPWKLSPDCASRPIKTSAPICWPGWNDAVEIKPDDTAEGLNWPNGTMRLSRNGAALWLIGAFQMAAGRPCSPRIVSVRTRSGTEPQNMLGGLGPIG